MADKSCLTCKHCFCEPDEDFCCGHPDAWIWGTYIRRAAAEGGHCGPDRTKYELHPLRAPNKDKS